ncbi:STAS/SEC14 domain-containing protein [Pontibacter sp. SGAir0037]|uniref:STAS/SEC14 domain-containing protein n=1 Tax=Pontibacter sp. SGAir0037 TaxID=2571030 RepID=UPI0010CCC728|nr:STAS/SEC14 domain-containing protein [Pontibacter sp. SGAir0037]QCR21702.1 hypothetical protein C1N53_04645 [Pontibacter sp. SGAir0037]
MLYTETDHFTIRYSAPLSMVEIVWHDSVASDQLQEGLNAVLEAIQHKSAQFFLADALKLNFLKHEDQAWIKNYFLPELHRLDVTRFARITEPNVLSLALVENIIDYVHLERHFNFEMQSFHERDTALEWLFSVVPVETKAL